MLNILLGLQNGMWWPAKTTTVQLVLCSSQTRVAPIHSKRNGEWKAWLVLARSGPGIESLICKNCASTPLVITPLKCYISLIKKGIQKNVYIFRHLQSAYHLAILRIYRAVKSARKPSMSKTLRLRQAFAQRATIITSQCKCSAPVASLSRKDTEFRTLVS